MAFKNSAGVKLNNETELIIRAAQDGEVESCYNIINNTEYVGGGDVPAPTFENIQIEVNDFSGATRQINKIIFSSEYDALVPYAESISGNSQKFITVAKNTAIRLTGNYVFEVINSDGIRIKYANIVKVENNTDIYSIKPAGE